MSDGKRKRRKRDCRHPTRGDAAPKPTAIELIHFCEVIGMNLFGDELHERRASLTRSGRRDSLEDKIRLGLTWWKEAGHLAARIIEEASPPQEFAKDARLTFRWLQSSNVPIPPSVTDQAEFLWNIACAEGEQTSVAAAVNKTRFKTERAMLEALYGFGYPSKLSSCLTLGAIERLRWLDKKWVQFQNRKRSADQRQRDKNKKTEKQRKGQVNGRSLSATRRKRSRSKAEQSPQKSLSIKKNRRSQRDET